MATAVGRIPLFFVTSVVSILIVFGINSGVSVAATEESPSTTNDLVLAVFIAMTLLLNIIAVAALVLGRRTRRMLLNGLAAMYHDNEVDEHYGPSLLSNYGVRYLLFAGVIVILAVSAIIVPLIIRLL